MHSVAETESAAASPVPARPASFATAIHRSASSPSASRARARRDRCAIRRGYRGRVTPFAPRVIAAHTGGWLRAVLREVDEAASRPGAPVVPGAHPVAVPVGEPVTYRIPIVPNAHSELVSTSRGGVRARCDLAAAGRCRRCAPTGGWSTSSPPVRSGRGSRTPAGTTSGARWGCPSSRRRRTTSTRGLPAPPARRARRLIRG
jgi:hypothetical protein